MNLYKEGSGSVHQMNKSITYLIILIIICTSIGCINQKSTKTSLNTLDNNTSTSVIKDKDVFTVNYSEINVLSPYNKSESEWLKTNASYIAKIVIDDSRAQKMIQEGGTIVGVVNSCHPTPENYIGTGCAPALRIQSEYQIVDFLVDEDKGQVSETVTEVISYRKSDEEHINNLKNENPDIRLSAAKALYVTGDGNAVEPLIEVLNDTEWTIRMNAAIALGQIGDKKAINPLIQLLDDENWKVRFCAAGALGEIGDDSAVLPLIQKLNDNDPDVRERAAQALGDIGNNTAVNPLIQTLEDESENEHVRAEAARALGKIEIRY